MVHDIDWKIALSLSNRAVQAKQTRYGSVARLTDNRNEAKSFLDVEVKANADEAR
jgi:hypothetical protein